MSITIKRSVDIEDEVRYLTQSRNDGETHGQIGNKVAIHNINVNVLSACSFQTVDVAFHISEVSREDRRRNFDHKKTSGKIV